MLEAIKLYFFPSLLNVFTGFYIISFLLKEKIIYQKIKIYLILLFLIIISIIILNYSPLFLRFVYMTFSLLLMSYIYFKKDIKLLLVTIFTEQLIVVISEIIFLIITIIFFKIPNNESATVFYGNIVSNIIISFFMILISRMKIVLKIYNHLLTITCKIKYDHIYASVFVLTLTINIILFVIYYDNSNLLLFIINFILSCLYFFIFYFAVNEKNTNLMYKEKNDILITYLNEYEKMLDYQRVNNHENKNQLLVIKSMIVKKDKKLLDYINEIIKEKREDNEIIYNMAKRIPSGGLQGLIYQKMLLMQEKNIEISLDINNQVRKIDLDKLSSKMNYDICRIVGIIIDNAIEESMKFDKKEREIIISMYIDGEFIIEISNRVKNDIDLNKIYEKGYTSNNNKKGRGYGLSLLKKIVDENDKLVNEVKIINNIFTQIVKIKM